MGEYMGLAAAKERQISAQLRHLEMEADHLLLDPATPAPPPSRSSLALPDNDGLRQEMRVASSEDLGAHLLDAAAVVEKVASSSTNLKGTFVRALRIAAQKCKAAGAEVSQRTPSSCREEALERENRVLKDKMAALEKKIECLMGEVSRLTNLLEGRLGERKTDQSVNMDELDRGGCPAQPSAAILRQHGEENLLHKIEEILEKKMYSLGLVTRQAQGDIHIPPIPPVIEHLPPLATGASEESSPRRRKKKNKKRKKVKRNQGDSGPQKPLEKQAAKTPSPSISTTAGDESWAKVVGRREKVAAKKTAKAVSTGAADKAPRKQPTKGKKEGGTSSSKGKSLPPRPPKTAVVALSIPDGCKTSLQDAMTIARQNINLGELGIAPPRMKRAVTGGLLLEIPGPDGAVKAKILAEKMAGVLSATGVKVAQPCKMAEIRLLGLDDSVSLAEVTSAVVDVAAVPGELVKVREIRRASSGLGTTVVRCPLVAARKIAAAGRLTVGWASAKAEYLPARPLQCHKCMQQGHVRAKCPSATDRSMLCYRCGAEGHKAGNCTASAPSCPVCRDAGRPSGHRLGSKKCSPPKVKRGGGALQVAPSTAQRGTPAPPATADVAPVDASGQTARPGGRLEEPMEATPST